MGTSLTPSREEGRCLELLDAGAETWGSEALFAGGGHGPEGGTFYFGGFGKRAHRMWGQELDCVWSRVVKAAVCPPGTLLCSQHRQKVLHGPTHLY